MALLRSMMLLLVASAFLLCVNGQVPSLGGCPKNVTTVSKLDIQQFLGVWYEIEAFPNFFQKGSCARAEYSLKEDGHIRVINMELVKGNVSKAIGDAYRPDDKEQGKLKVRFSDFAPYGNYWVIDIAYQSHLLVYSCQDVAGIFKMTFAWVLARERTLDPLVVKKLESELSLFGVDVSPFKKQDQSNCPF